MKKRTYILASLIVTALVTASAIWNWSAQTARAQKSDDNLGIAVAYDARNEFSNTQNPNGVWSYGYSNSDIDNTLNLFTFPADSTSAAGCGGGIFEAWRLNNGDQIPQVARHNPKAACLNIPENALFMHPGYNNQRAVTRWTAPVGGTFQITGTFQKQNPSATTDLKIIKNAATAGETTLFTAAIGAVSQQAFNFTVTVAAGERLDFSVGDDGNNTWQFDGSSIVINIGQPVAACLPAPANLQVNVPGENSPSDVESVNTNAQLVGDATYTNTGKVGRAFDFDGNGDYVRVEDSPAQRPATAVTAEGWFKFHSIAGIVSLISKPVRGSALNSYTLYLDGGQLRGLVGNQSQYTRVFSSFTPQLGVWHHLAFTYDYTGGVSALKLYANGVEVTSGQDGTPNLPLYYDANPFPLLIGGEFESNAPAFFLDGQADEISVYGRALSPAEIFDIVRRGSFGKCSPAACTEAPNGLVSLFAGEGNALDSRSNNHGASQNGAGFAKGKVGRAFSLDGVDDRILIGDPVPPSLQIQNDISLNAWIYVTEYPTGEGLGLIVGSQYDVTSSGASIFLDGRTNPDGQPSVAGHIHFQIGDGSFHVTNAQTAVPLNQWVHISANRRANEEARIYYNGVLQPSTSAPWSGAISYNGAWFAIGQQKDINRPFKGLIDEVSIFNRSLAQSEVQSIVNAGSAGICKPVATNPAANQIAWFTGDGDARDFLGLNPNGILRGDANFRVGRVGQSFNLDGSGDYVEVADDPDHRPANDITVEGWFNVRSISDSHFVSKPIVGTNSNSYVVWYDGGVMRAGHGDQFSNFETLSTSFSPNLNTWYHFAYTVDDANNVHRFYINGAEIASAASTLPLFYDASPHPLLIGAEYGPPATPYSFVDGQMDEISLYSRALSASEVAAVYNAGAAGKVKAKTINILPPAITKRKAAKSVFAFPALLLPATVQLSDATVTFANLTSSGTVSENGIDLGLLPPLPSSVIFTGLAYDISTTAGYQNGAADDVQVCFNLPSLAALDFASLRILHLENGAWVNRTAAGNTSPTLCTDNLTSLSGGFVIVQALAPTAANVSVTGKVMTANGAGISGASVTLTDSQGRSRSAKTGSFGFYSFKDVAAGEIYIVSVSAKRYTFTVASQAVSVQDAVENVDFTADGNF